MFWLTLLAFLIILGLLVFVHEGGHFIVAKLSDVKVEEFAFGFPPRLFSWKKGETRYSINAIPFGGYVKMLGEEKESDSPRSFSRKKARFKFLIVVAGVIMNFILAGVLLSVGYMIGMSPISLNPDTLAGQKTHQIVIAQVNNDSPAQVADLRVGDLILGFDSTQSFVDFTKSNLDRDVKILIKRKGETIEKSAHISKNAEAPLGVGIIDVPLVKLTPLGAIYAGFKDMILTTGYVFTLLKDFLSGLFIKGKISEGVAGPVGIFNITGEAVRMGIIYLIQLAAVLSINLGMINILPFPALDGGRAVIILCEGITRRKVLKTEVENLLHILGFAILMLFVLIITFREVIALL
jgi:regulator of sigma E protease